MEPNNSENHVLSKKFPRQICNKNHQVEDCANHNEVTKGQGCHARCCMLGQGNNNKSHKRHIKISEINSSHVSSQSQKKNQAVK